MELIGRGRRKAVVRDFYQRILSRNPDPIGAKIYESLIDRIGLVRAIPEMIGAFLESDEYRRRLSADVAAQINSAIFSNGEQLINGLPVSHIVSLGPFCLPSIILQNNGIKKYSLPFDWIFSMPHLVVDCLADDFDVFLDRRYYASISHSRKDPGAEHSFYRDRYGITELFAHRDPTREEDYQYFVRCANRFRRLLRNSDAKVFFAVGRPAHDFASTFRTLLDALNRVTTNFVLLCVEVADPVEPGVTSLTPVIKAGDHAFYRFTPSSFDGARGVLPEKFDEWTILRLICRYRINLKDRP